MKFLTGYEVKVSPQGRGVRWAGGQLPCVREGAVDSFSFDILSEK